MKCLKFLLLIGFCVIAFIAEAQQLKKVDSGFDPCALLGCDNEVTSVELISETEQSCTIEINYKGFKDKKYKIKGKLLLKSKKQLREVEMVTDELPRNGSSIDLEFAFVPKTGYKKDYVEAKYLAFSICDASDSLCDLDFGGLNLSGNDFLFHLDKKFEIGDCEGCLTTPQEITVKLIPFKSAKQIKP